MKRFIFSLLVLSGVAGAAQAQTVTVADVEALPGETVTAALHLEAPADTYTGTVFALQFPETGFSTGGNAASGWAGSIENGTMTEGKVKFAAAASKPFETATIEVEFTVDATVALGDYDVTVTDIEFQGAGRKDAVGDVTFTVHVVSVHSVVLDENSTTAPEASNGAVNVRVLRTINANEWSTICLPFAMTAAQVKDAFGDDVELGDFNGYVYDDDAETITVNFTNATAIEANHPYIIKVSSKVEEFAAYGVEVDPEDEPMVNKGTSRRPKAIIGTYVANTVIENGCLFLSGNKFWYSVGSTKTKAYRAYFNFNDLLPDFEDNYAESRISMSFDISTAINEIANRESSNSECFDLQGRHINGKSSMVNGQLKKGLYIVNGKKVIK